MILICLTIVKLQTISNAKFLYNLKLFIVKLFSYISTTFFDYAKSHFFCDIFFAVWQCFGT